MRETEIHLPSIIYLYDGGKATNLDLHEIAKYIKRNLGNIEVELRKDFVTHWLSSTPSNTKEQAIETLANKLARCKIRKIDTKEQDFEPLLGEIDYERRNLFYEHFGILYDGFKLCKIFAELIPANEHGFDFCHIIFTNQIFGTWDENDKRYHARVSVYGFPSIISTSGIVEAPAKPKEFYLKQQMGIPLTTLKSEFKGRFIDYDDVRLTEVLKGYTMQALFFHMMGEPFCENKNCRLYNAHWQEEVIQAQLNSHYEFCDQHQMILNKIKK